MKNIIFLYVIILSITFLNCKKEKDSATINSSRLTGIQDSMMVLSFTYAGDKIIDATDSVFGSALKSNYANFEYSGGNEIKVS